MWVQLWLGKGTAHTVPALRPHPVTPEAQQQQKKNYNSKKEDLEEEDQGEDERNVIL